MRSALVGIRRLPLYVDVVRRLGLGWAAFRVRYALEIRLGVHERRTPIVEWPRIPIGGPRPAPVVSAATLAHALRQRADEDERERLQDLVDDLEARRFNVFGTKVDLESWHHDPIGGAVYPRGVHWSRVREFEHADIKRVWEPSRFGWAFDLARAEIVLPESGAGDLFWELLEEWCAQNPPNEGVNWACGQEASLRLIAITCAAQAMPHLLNDERDGTLRMIAGVTGSRVASNIAYARSQRNNHHASEAVGLLTASYLLSDDPQAAQWWRTGERHLREVCERLVLPDGGTSQYSTNYHRVFVHVFVWAAQLYRASRLVLPEWLESAGRSSARFLQALVDPVSGYGPFFGPDDGARVLPLSSAPHRFLADDVALAVACFWGSQGREPHVEPGAWFGLDTKGFQVCAEKLDGPWCKSFPDSGIHLLGYGKTRVFVRAHTPRFRPSHDDQLHCDIWIDGCNVAPDAGTASYHPAPDEPGLLDGPEFHNGPRLGGKPSMAKVSRFLWARWSMGSAERLVVKDSEVVEGTFCLKSFAGHVVRSVQVRADTVVITDRGNGTEPMQAVWRVNDAGGRISVVCSSPFEIEDGVIALGYGVWKLQLSYVCAAASDNGLQFTVANRPGAVS